MIDIHEIRRICATLLVHPSKDVHQQVIKNTSQLYQNDGLNSLTHTFKVNSSRCAYSRLSSYKRNLRSYLGGDILNVKWLLKIEWIAKIKTLTMA